MAAGDITALRSAASDVFGAAKFDGIDDFVEIPKSSVTNFGTSNFSLACWFQSPLPNLSAFISNGGTYAGGVRYFLGTNGVDGKITFILDDNVMNPSATSNTSMGDSKWHHAVGVRNGNNLNVYIDGTVTGNTGDATGIGSIDTAQPFYLGASKSEGTGLLATPLKGCIKDVKIYNKALSQTEITALAAGQDINRGSLVAEYKLQSDYLDTSGHGNDGTNTGSFLTNTLTNKIKADMTGLNLGAATDKIIALPRRGSPTIITAKRAAA